MKIIVLISVVWISLFAVDYSALLEKKASQKKKNIKRIKSITKGFSGDIVIVADKFFSESLFATKYNCISKEKVGNIYIFSCKEELMSSTEFLNNIANDKDFHIKSVQKKKKYRFKTF